MTPASSSARTTMPPLPTLGVSILTTLVGDPFRPMRASSSSRFSVLKTGMVATLAFFFPRSVGSRGDASSLTTVISAGRAMATFWQPS